MAVTEHLNLDVPRFQQQLFNVDFIVGEGPQSFASSISQRRPKLIHPIHHCLIAREPVAWGPTQEVLTPANLLAARRMVEAHDPDAADCARAA